jgi:hypothetical protein
MDLGTPPEPGGEILVPDEKIRYRREKIPFSYPLQSLYLISILKTTFFTSPGCPTITPG